MKGPRCSKCPVNEWDCDAQYRGSRCAELRAKAGTDKDPETNADRIRAMSDEELADFLDECERCGYHDYSIARTKEGYLMNMLAWLQQPAEETT